MAITIKKEEIQLYFEGHDFIVQPLRSGIRSNCREVRQTKGRQFISYCEDA